MKGKIVSLQPIATIQDRIFAIRGEYVMIDRDLAELYQVPTKVLNQTVKRNIERFPDGFIFRLTKIERNQLVTNCDRFRNLKHASQCPYAFTEHGVAMLSSVLRSKRAIRVNIQIIKTFVQLRHIIAGNKNLHKRLDDLEKKYDGQFRIVFDALRKLIEPPPIPKRRIGF